MESTKHGKLVSFILSSCFFASWRFAHGSTFKFVNNCDYTVWPGILSGAGTPPLSTTGFQLQTGATQSLNIPAGWSGRFWGRTGCSISSTNNQFTCATGDCRSGTVECSGAGATTPATLAEFTLGKSGGKDFYDVSLVDGYNLPMVIDGTGDGGECTATGCPVDLNKRCPKELRIGDGEACKSACEAFGNPEYCCSGAFANPNTCRPSVYSQMFKAACPRSYSYAYDDATSTFTCVAADYIITFCPSTVPRLKSSGDPKSKSNSDDPPRTTTASTAILAANDAWLAGLATGDAPPMRALFHRTIVLAATITAILFWSLL